MGNFNIISFADLMQRGESNFGNERTKPHAIRKRQVPSEGVYIQDINGKLWKTEDWNNSAKPNAVAVIAKEDKFLIALVEPLSRMSISLSYTALEKYMATTSSSAEAKADYNGVGNTANILKMMLSTDCAAGYCNAFIFPDGTTKGFLPSIGQLNLAYQNKAAVDAALKKCGGTAMNTSSYYWSSTFRGMNGNDRFCWTLRWSDGNVDYGYLGNGTYVRPFASFER